MASNNQRAPSAPPPSRWSNQNNESKKNSKEHQKLILDQVKEMFDSILEPDIILSVVQNCKWKLQPSIDALIMLSESAELPLNRGNENWVDKSSSLSEKTEKRSSSVDNSQLEDEKDHKLNSEKAMGSSIVKTASANSYLNLNEKELKRQKEEFEKFELLKRDNSVLNDDENSATGRFWESSTSNNSNPSIPGDKKIKETSDQFTSDNLFGSKLQFSRDSPKSKIPSKGTIPKSIRTPQSVNIDPAIISSAPKNPLTLDDARAREKQRVEQFESRNYETNETKVKSNPHKTETESLCGLKVQYRLPGLENSSDDDADVVIEEETCDYQTQIPSLMSVNVCQFLSSNNNKKAAITPVEIMKANTPSPPKSPQRNNNNQDDKIKSIKCSILNGHKVLIILRGLPGAGKTYLASSIVESTIGGDESQFIFSSDDYFLMIGRGVYHYVRSKLNEAHEYNHKRSFKAMREGVSPVIIDNTNTKAWEMKPYAAVGVQNGYRVEVIEPNTPWCRNINELAKKNFHGVQKEFLKKMLERFERNIDGVKLLDIFSLKYSEGMFPPQIRRFPPFQMEEEEGEEERREKRNIKITNPNTQSSSSSSLAGSKNRNRRKKRNSNNPNCDITTTTDPMNYLLSYSDRNMKHEENSPGGIKNEENTLDNIVSNALNAENDTLNKSLVDYCIETDSGDEIDSDRVPERVENPVSDDKSGPDLLAESPQTEKKNPFSSPLGNREEKSAATAESGSEEALSAKKMTHVGHQNLIFGAIGSERKGSVTNIDSDNLEFDRMPEKIDSDANVLSQCWDFTLLVNGREIHSTCPPRKSNENEDFKDISKKDLEEEEEEETSELTSGVMITEITDDIEMNEFLEPKIPLEESEAIINKIINKMDASEQEMNSLNKTEEPKDSEKSSAGASSFGSIFNIIKKSFLGLNSEEKEPEPGENESEESIMRFKYQTNDNSLSENDAFENERSHREPTNNGGENVLIEVNEDENDADLAVVTIVGDNLSDKLIDVDSSFDEDGENQKIKVSEPVTFDTTTNIQNPDLLVQDNLSIKLSETSRDIKNRLKSQDQVSSSLDSEDNNFLKNIPEQKNNQEEDDFSLENKKDSESSMEINFETDDPIKLNAEDDRVYDILSEAVNRIISEQESERKYERKFNYHEGSSSDDEKEGEGKSESSQTKSSYLTSKSAIIDKKSKDGEEDKALGFSNDEKEESELKNKEEEIVSLIERNLELLETNKDSFIGYDSDSSIEECCDNCYSDISAGGGESTMIKDVERVGETRDDKEEETVQIIDNMNQVTWKESPFPVPLDSVNSLLQKAKQPEKIIDVEKTDSFTNTSNYDFNVLYVGGTSEPEYKILATKSRTINTTNSILSALEKPPLKLMLDKSSMTSVVDILSGEEGSLEFKSEIQSIKDLEELVEMFPNLPREDIQEIYNNCSCNFSWTVDMILDGVPEDLTKYGKIKAPKILLRDRRTSGSDPGDLESQNSTPRKEFKGDNKLNRQSSSAESSNDGESKSQQHNSSPRKKRDRHKVSEENLELKRQIEEKMIINEACYNPHVLRVKRWKNGEPDIPIDEKDHREKSVEEFTEDTESPKSSESNDDFTEDDLIDEEEMMELTLGKNFIKVLENEFGNPEFQFPGGLFPVIQIKKSMAQQLHALWIESMELQLNAQQEQLDMMIQKDAEYARSLEQEEAESLTDPSFPNIPEIMDMEMALAIYHNDLKKQIESETPNDMASRLTRQMLHDMFTDHDPDTLDEILNAHNGNFKETVEVLEASTGKVVNSNDTLKKQQSLIDRAQKESIQSNKEERTRTSIVVVNPELGQPSNSNSNFNSDSTLTYDAAWQEAKAARKEAERQLLLRNENFNKAQEAIRKGNREVAGYYSQMAKLHAKKREWANSTAASAFLAAQDYRMNTENTLDLHYLYVAEALQALEVFLDFQISRLNEGNKKSINLYIITGRGARSSQGLSRIKPAVSKKLASKNIRFIDENPGCLKVVIHKRGNAGV